MLHTYYSQAFHINSLPNGNIALYRSIAAQLLYFQPVANIHLQRKVCLIRLFDFQTSIDTTVQAKSPPIQSFQQVYRFPMLALPSV